MIWASAAWAQGEKLRHRRVGLGAPAAGLSGGARGREVLGAAASVYGLRVVVGGVSECDASAGVEGGESFEGVGAPCGACAACTGLVAVLQDQRYSAADVGEVGVVEVGHESCGGVTG